MLYIRDIDRATEVWREGVETRMFASAETGAHQLTVFEQWCEPGHGAPNHVHAVEEVLRVVSGVAQIWVEDRERDVGSNESVIVPAGVEHGFMNHGPDLLHTIAILAAPVFEARYTGDEREERRWLPRK